MVELPPYKLVYETLRKEISEGVYASGDLLPSEHTLCARFDVARPTLRKALNQLVSDGFIYKRQGKGSVIKGTPKGIGILSLSGTTSAFGGHVRTEVLQKPQHRSWTEAFSFPVSAQERAVGCIYFERLRFVNDVPLLLDITMLPNYHLPDFDGIDFENASLFEILRRHYQIEVTGGTQQLFAIKANKRMQELLGVKYGAPVLQLNRKIETTRAGYCFYSQLFCVTGDYGLIGNF